MYSKPGPHVALTSNRWTSLMKKKPSAHHAGLCRAVLPRPAAERLHLSVINSAGSVLNATATEFLHVSMYAAAVLHPSRTSDQLLSLCVPKGGASSLDSAPPCVGGAFFVSIFSLKEEEQASRADDAPRPGNPLEQDLTYTITQRAFPAEHGNAARR